jgi:hypothetical protein
MTPPTPVNRFCPEGAVPKVQEVRVLSPLSDLTTTHSSPEVTGARSGLLSRDSSLTTTWVVLFCAVTLSRYVL